MGSELIPFVVCFAVLFLLASFVGRVLATLIKVALIAGAAFYLLNHFHLLVHALP